MRSFLIALLGAFLACLQVHAKQEKRPNVVVVLCDDLLATGGTAAASVQLIEQAGGRLTGCAFVVELADLNGRNRLPQDLPVESLITYG